MSISVNASAEALSEYFSRNGIQGAQTEAAQAYERTKQFALPRRKLDAAWTDFKRRSNATYRVVHGSLQPTAETLRIAFEAKTYFEGFLADWPKASLAEQRKLWAEDESLGFAATRAANAPIAHSVAPTFSAGAFIGDMAQKGIRIDAVKDGITATPADRLTDQDRALIRANKAALLAALSNAAVIA